MNELIVAGAAFIGFMALTLYLYRHDIASFVRLHYVGTDISRYDGMTPEDILMNADARIEELIR